MFNPSNFSIGTPFKVKGDPSQWEVVSIDGNRIKARNKQNGVEGFFPVGNVTEILNVAKAEIKNEDIKIIGHEYQPKESTINKNDPPKGRGRKRNK